MSHRAVFVKFLQGGVRVLVLASEPGPCHSWIRVLGGRSLSLLEFAPGRVDWGGGAKIEPS